MSVPLTLALAVNLVAGCSRADLGLALTHWMSSNPRELLVPLLCQHSIIQWKKSNQAPAVICLDHGDTPTPEFSLLSQMPLSLGSGLQAD